MLAQGQETPGAGSGSLESSSPGFSLLPVCWFGGGAGSGAALSRRLSRKSTEPQSQSAGAPEPTLAAAQVEKTWCSRRDTGCDTGQTGRVQIMGRRPRHGERHTCTNLFQCSMRHAGTPAFCFRSDLNGCCCCWREQQGKTVCFQTLAVQGA